MDQDGPDVMPKTSVFRMRRYRARRKQRTAVTTITLHRDIVRVLVLAGLLTQEEADQYDRPALDRATARAVSIWAMNVLRAKKAERREPKSDRR